MTDSPSEIARRMVANGIDSLAAHLLHEPPTLPLVPRRSDFDLNPELRPESPRTLAPAAVLLAIVESAREPTVLFTRRTEHLSRHAGQVSFPGGRAQDGDRTLIETALRETHEETGIAAEFVSVAGFLDPYETGTGYAILPVVGLLREGYMLVPEVNEVAEIFEVPLAFLLDPKNRERRTGEWQGRKREFYAFEYNGHYIWGATAAMLVNLRDRFSL
ncbi:MAG TPA: CoA pyrophosphatase [Rhizomicrobium sp.]|nr:CoA pyrophosphatase [Rhizomicrobium sp.]